jgi:prolyl-tRNA editing enzyme YbaK/EbsC (Cys-tRNA(Pro) deacylase)
MTADPEGEVLESLRSLAAPYERLECDPEYADTAAFCARYGFAPDESANTILVASKKEPRQYAACVALATTSLDVNHKVRELMGVTRLSFASPEDTAQVTGMLVGGVTPFGLPDGIPVYVDALVMERARVILGGGGRSSKIRVAPDVLTRLPAVRVVAGLARPREG